MQQEFNVTCESCGRRCEGQAYRFEQTQCGDCFFTQCRQEQAGTFPFVGVTVAQARATRQQ